MLYKPGDKVLVRSDLVVGHFYASRDHYVSDTFETPMKRYLGQIVTIDRVCTSGKYTIKEMGYNWTDEMFDGLAEPIIEIENISQTLDNLL